jgi:hypothetical protein
VFKKTNVYDSITLSHTFDLIAKWFLHLEESGEPFPSNFDFTFFFQGIYIALDIDHSISIAKVLSLLYRTMHYYPGENKHDFIMELLKRHFYRFFFHWCYNIREMFYLILMYQIEFKYLIQYSHKLSKHDSSVRRSYASGISTTP